MKTKTFKVGNNTIRQAVWELLSQGKRISKKSITDIINKHIEYCITNGNFDYPIFCITTYDDLKSESILEYDWCKHKKAYTDEELNSIADTWVYKLK